MQARLVFAVLVPLSAAGCATGYATDWFRDRPSIITPQLLRYGLDVEQSRCVGQKLGERLSRQQLRRFQESAAAVRPANTAGPLTLNHLRAVAGSRPNREVAPLLDTAVTECNVPAPTLAAATAGAAVPAADGAAPVTMSGGVPVDMTPLPARTSPTWLNLGSAESGQSIAIEAMSIEQEGAARTAWFRMSDPDSGAATNNAYRLRIDCQARTIQPLALRQTDAAGAETSLRQYTPAEAVAGPAEAGTVLEIAFLSLCT